MERNFTDENFEEFLRQNADGLRMRPSDRVWKGISKNINREKRRFGFLLGLFLLTSLGTGYYLVQETNGHGQPAATSTARAAQPTGSKPGQNLSPAISSRTTSTDRTPASGFAPIQRTASGNIPAFSLFPEPLTIQEPASITAPVQQENAFTSTIVDSYDEQPTVPEAIQNGLSASHATDPLTIESVVNAYRFKRRKKASVQFFFTPTVSYRKLGENKSYLRSQAGTINTANVNYSNVNSVVTHKPDFGFELGMAVKYPLTKNLRIKAGVQFNISRYDIKAYNSSIELATIMLNSRSGQDSLRTITSYNNINGYRSNWLQSYYLQLSAPVGVEYTIGGNRNVKFGVGTSIQPTYVLSDRNYVLTTDYKNYAEVPDLTRRWNVNTNLETFVAYSTGKLQWQVGPQVRYQLLSSFLSKYPVKENLFDFGLKVGISLNNQ